MPFSKKWCGRLSGSANGSAPVSSVGRRLLRGSAKPTARRAVPKHREPTNTVKPPRHAFGRSAGPSLDDKPQDGNERHGDRGRAATSRGPRRGRGKTSCAQPSCFGCPRRISGTTATSRIDALPRRCPPVASQGSSPSSFTRLSRGRRRWDTRRRPWQIIFPMGKLRVPRRARSPSLSA